jgi:hypothetical protein
MARESEVLALQWPDFLKKMSTDWHPGEHWAFVVPTGGGKTTFAAGLMSTRRYCLALDVKGGDKTLKKLKWERLLKWPPTRQDRQDMSDGKPFRRVVGSTDKSPDGKLRRYDLCKRIIKDVLQEGGYTILATDAKILTHPKFGGLWDDYEELLLLARDVDLSVLTDMQRVSGQPRESNDQATWLAVGYTRDVDAVNRLSEMMGRSRAEIRGAVDALGDLPFGFLVVNRDPHAPIIVTRAEEL